MASRLEPVLRQRIFEARYEHGWRYLDRCGELMLILENLLEEYTGCAWMAGEISPASAHLKCPGLDMVLLFNARRLVLDQNPVGDVDCDFTRLAADALATLKARFDLREMNRFGSRRIKIVPADSVDDAQKLSVKWCPVKEWRRSPSSTLPPREYECTSSFEAEDRSRGVQVIVKPYAAVGTELKVDERLRLPPHHLHERQREALVEQLKRARQRRQEPEAGLLIDIDYYALWPPEGYTVSEFLKEAQEVADILESDLIEERRR